ncbi:ribulose-phosphate 3-epimerase [Patescibacteria group bacterium]|nr:ribulose-phosphate 3-epimerase [Patescibacteria group bacterium]
MLKKKLIPAILATDKKQLIDKIDAVEDFVEYIQIDYMDGKFIPQKTNITSQDLYKLNPLPATELHMMVNHPEYIIEDWITAGTEKFIIHIESLVDWDQIFKIYHDNYIKLYVAINPDTPISKIEKYIPKLDGVTVMGVNPGKGNQNFIPQVLRKIKTLRNRYPNLNIQVDGGMHTKPKNIIKQVLLAGANEIVAGSEIFLSTDIDKKIEDLENLITSS